MQSGAASFSRGCNPLALQKLNCSGTGRWSLMTSVVEAVDLLNPVGELAGIGDGGRQGNQLHRRRTVNDRFLPDRAPLGKSFM